MADDQQEELYRTDPAPQLAADGNCTIFCRMIPMRDRVRLHTVIYLPGEGSGKYPVLLFRTPYASGENILLPDERCLKRRTAYIQQSCRGTGLSEGVFDPAEKDTEIRDAEDFSEWLAEQPWYAGRCVMEGGSYLGWCQWAAAAGSFSGLLGVTPRIAPLYGCLGCAVPGGGSRLGFTVGWLFTQTLKRMHRDDFDEGCFHHLPSSSMDAAAGLPGLAPYRKFMVSASDPALLLCGWEHFFKKIAVPALVSGGWFDHFKGETIASFQMMKRCAATPAARNFTRLHIGPWTHNGLKNPELFGGEHTLDPLVERMDRFMFHLLEDPERDPLEGEPQVRYFILFENRWYSASDWPPPESGAVSWYLHSGGHANTLYGDGVLNQLEPGDECPDTFVSDPSHPVPAHRGDRHSLGCYDRSVEEEREDVLVFSSDPLTQKLKIAGEVMLYFFAEVSTPDTDIFAHLTCVLPDGGSYRLTGGMVRARFRESLEEEKLLSPGEVCRYTISLSHIAASFPAGSQLRLELCGQDFPMYDRNANTGGRIGEDEILRQSRIRILHDGEHPAVLELPQLRGGIHE